jgi:hypothetical protein
VYILFDFIGQLLICEENTYCDTKVLVNTY